MQLKSYKRLRHSESLESSFLLATSIHKFIPPVVLLQASVKESSGTKTLIYTNFSKMANTPVQFTPSAFGPPLRACQSLYDVLNALPECSVNTPTKNLQYSIRYLSLFEILPENFEVAPGVAEQLVALDAFCVRTKESICNAVQAGIEAWPSFWADNSEVINKNLDYYHAVCAVEIFFKSMFVPLSCFDRDEKMLILVGLVAGAWVLSV